MSLWQKIVSKYVWKKDSRTKLVLRIVVQESVNKAFSCLFDSILVLHYIFAEVLDVKFKHTVRCGRVLVDILEAWVDKGRDTNFHFLSAVKEN